jgi:hypothetical protein
VLWAQASLHFNLNKETQTLGLIEIPVDSINSHGFYGLRVVHHFVRKLWQKDRKNQSHFSTRFLLTFFCFNALPHISRVAQAGHQAVAIKARVCCVRVCMQFQHSSLHFDSQFSKSCENQGCSLTFCV